MRRGEVALSPIAAVLADRWYLGVTSASPHCLRLLSKHNLCVQMFG